MLKDIPSVRINTKNGRLNNFNINTLDLSNVILDYKVEQDNHGLATITVSFTAQVNEDN